MRSMVHRVSAPLVFTLALSLAAQSDLVAQEAFNGDWALDISSSEFGNSPVPDSAFLSIEATGEDLVITGVRYFAEHGIRHTWFDMPVDGEVHAVKTDEGEFDSTASWDDGTLAIWRIAESNVGELELNERLSLKDDGATLVRSIDIEIPGMGEAYQVMEYTRKD